MAKPGSDAARRLSAAGVDLRAAAMSDDEAREVQEQLEFELGARCSGCGRRIGLGFRFTSLDVRDPKRPVLRLAACSREDCDFADRARDGATFIEQVEFAWADEGGLDVPPARAVARRDARRTTVP